MKKTYQIAGYDMPCVDLAVNVDVFPKPNGSTGVRDLSWQGGGKVATGMVAAARLGAKCAMLGAVGSDDYGRFVLKDFERHGIDISGMQVREDATTSLSIVLSDRETEGRSIVYRSGTAEPPAVGSLREDIITDCEWFFISHGSEICLDAAHKAKAAGAKIIIDADSYDSNVMENLHLIDAFVASEFVYEVLFRNGSFEENCKSVYEMGTPIVVFTLGPKGCVGYSAEGFFQLPAYPVRVADTVGAGDVFHGAFAVGLAEGMTPKAAAELATAAACIKCTRIGGRAGIPDRPTAERFMKTGEIDYTEIDQRTAFYGKGLQV